MCKGDRRVELLDADTLEPAASIALSGDTGHEVGARAGTPYAYVPIYGTGVVGAPAGMGNGIDVIDVPAGIRTATLPVPRSSYPHHVVVRRDGSLVVTGEGRASLLLVAPDSRRVQDIPLDQGQGHMVIVSTDGETAWTAHVRPGYVVEVDLRRRRAGRSLFVANEINRISLAPDAKTAFVADQTSPRIACLDLSTMTVRAWMDLPGTAFGTAPTPDGRHLILALRGRSSLAVLELATGLVSSEVSVPTSPQAVVLDPSGRFAYTACTPADEVVVIDLDQANLVSSRRVGTGADGLAFWSAVDVRED